MSTPVVSHPVTTSQPITPVAPQTNSLKTTPKTSATPSQPKINLAGLPKLAHSISINNINATQVSNLNALSTESDRILNQEEFDKYWKQTIKEMSQSMPELLQLLNGVKVIMGENNQFVLEAYNGYFESEFKKYKVALLTKLRDNAEVRGLNCTVNIVRTAQEAVIYRPADKYADMLTRNPELAKLRKLFTSLDY